MWLWMGLVVLRLGWVLMPQSAYIHPDEFFQTVEVVAGDALSIDVHRTWEFEEEFPIRSIVLPKLLFQPVFACLHYIGQSSTSSILTTTGYKLVVGPRLVMAVLSLFIDSVVYRLCKMLKLDGYKGIVLLASSYVMLTYQCHTFTNSIETLLFTLLVFVIFKSVIQNRDCSNGSQSDMGNISKTVGQCRKTDLTKSSGIGMKKTRNDNAEDISNETSLGGNSEFHDHVAYRRRTKKANIKTTCNKSPVKKISEKQRSENDEELTKVEAKESNEKLSPIVQSMSQSISSDILMKTCILIAFINVVGIFNRPTFVLFSALPLLYWFFYFIYPLWRAGKMVAVFDRLSVLILTSSFTAFIFCEIDTHYFKGVSFLYVVLSSASNCLMIADSREIFSCYRLVVGEYSVVTPWNFISYNTKADNLAEHGIHPQYLHMLVNMPLLFGPLVYYIVKSLALHIRSSLISISNTLKRSKTKLQKKSKTTKFSLFKTDKTEKKKEIPLHIFIIIPILLFSVFPHQEPRFLIPLLPLVILNVVFISKSFSKYFLSIFVTFNLVLSLVFGILHQGGIVPCLMKLQTEYNSLQIGNQSNSSLTLIFSHTYMPPRHLLLSTISNVNVIDLKGSNATVLLDTVNSVKEGTYLPPHEESYTPSPSSTNRIFLILPGTVIDDLDINKLLNGSIIHTFFPHLSFEDPPKFNQLINHSFPDIYEELYRQLSLIVMEIV